ncbi:serine protease [Beggiatoa sp. PS]|nr:serine protease [Beggiatoa sp. PS]
MERKKLAPAKPKALRSSTTRTKNEPKRINLLKFLLIFVVIILGLKIIFGINLLLVPIILGINLLSVSGLNNFSLSITNVILLSLLVMVFGWVILRKPKQVFYYLNVALKVLFSLVVMLVVLKIIELRNFSMFIKSMMSLLLLVMVLHTLIFIWITWKKTQVPMSNFKIGKLEQIFYFLEVTVKDLLVLIVIIWVLFEVIQPSHFSMPIKSAMSLLLLALVFIWAIPQIKQAIPQMKRAISQMKRAIPQMKRAISQMKRGLSPLIGVKTIGTFVVISGLILIVVLFKPFGKLIDTEFWQGQGITENQMTIEELKKATVYITVEDDQKTRTGSGFLVHKTHNRAYIITNTHVLFPDERKRVEVKVFVTFNSGELNEITTRVNSDQVSLYPQSDIAIMSIGNARLDREPRLKPLFESVKPIKVSPNLNVTETQTIHILGFPFGKALATNQKNPAITISKGIISSNRKDENGQTILLQIDGNLNPGNSGGPVVTLEGIFVGVATATINPSVGQGIGFVIPTNQINRMLSGNMTNIIAKVKPLTSESEQLKITLRAELIDLLNRIKQASVILVPENFELLQQAYQVDGSWQKITPNQVTNYRFRDESRSHSTKMMTSISLPKGENRHYYGQIILQKQDNQIVYQSPFRLKINLNSPGQQLEIKKIVSIKRGTCFSISGSSK